MSCSRDAPLRIPPPAFLKWPLPFETTSSPSPNRPCLIWLIHEKLCKHNSKAMTVKATQWAMLDYWTALWPCGCSALFVSYRPSINQQHVGIKNSARLRQVGTRTYQIHISCVERIAFNITIVHNISLLGPWLRKFSSWEMILHAYTRWLHWQRSIVAIVYLRNAWRSSCHMDTSLDTFIKSEQTYISRGKCLKMSDFSVERLFYVQCEFCHVICVM